MKKERLMLILTGILYSINAVISVYTTQSIANVMNCVETQHPEQLLKNILVAIAILIAEKASSLAMSASNLHYTSIADIRLRNKLVHSLFHRPTYAFKSKDTAYYLNLFTNDIPLFRSGCLESYPWLIYFISDAIFSMYLLLRNDITLAVVTLFLASLPILADKSLSKYVANRKDAYSQEAELYTGILTETIEGYETIKTNGSSNQFILRINLAGEKMRKSAARMTFANEVSREAFFSAASIIRIVILCIGAYLSVRNHTTVSSLFASINYAIAVSNSFSNISNYIIEIKSTKKISDKLKTESSVTPNLSTLVFPNCPTIHYQNFSLTLGTKELHKNINFTFEFGKCYAIVGASGSGKSSLMNALLGSLISYTGKILVNNSDIKDFSEEEIYNNISIVDQNRWLMNSSLFDNITMLTSFPDKDSSEYKKLIKQVRLESFLLDKGDCALGDLGENISGGEKQRICIARALRRNTQILIFDEPTVGLDPLTVDIVNDLIFSLSGTTRIVITHNQSNDYLKQFDDVIRIS